MRRLFVLLLILMAACSTGGGVEAPPVSGTEIACMSRGCVTYPAGWTVEVGDDYVSLNHPADPDLVLGTLGLVDMEGLVEAAGGTWPASPVQVIDALFFLLGEDQDADLDGRPLLADDGSASAVGRIEDLRFFYRLVPLEGTTALGIEVRAPNGSWASHADVMLGGVEPLP